MMESNTLRRALTTHPHTNIVFRDVIPADGIPKKKESWGVYVVNTHTHDKEGEHWVVVRYTPQATYYMDPYGLKPNALILKQIEQTLPHLPVLYHSKQLQGIYPTCGHYCIYYILTLVTTKHLDVFKDDLIFNDHLVQTLVQKEFDV